MRTISNSKLWASQTWLNMKFRQALPPSLKDVKGHLAYCVIAVFCLVVNMTVKGMFICLGHVKVFIYIQQ